jgi:hypothetical protein
LISFAVGPTNWMGPEQKEEAKVKISV